MPTRPPRALRSRASEVAGDVERQELLGIGAIDDGDVEAEVMGAVHPWVHRQLEGQCRRIARGEGSSAEGGGYGARSEEHTSELQSLMRSPYAGFCLKHKMQHLTL